MHALIHRTALALATTTLLLAAQLANAQSAEQKYQSEVARCNSGQSQQDRTTCLREAGAARDEARKGNLATPAPAAADSNATDRCKAQPAADQAACIQRITGAGNTTTQGSVAGGGVIRETVTPVKP